MKQSFVHTTHQSNIQIVHLLAIDVHAFGMHRWQLRVVTPKLHLYRLDVRELRKYIERPAAEHYSATLFRQPNRDVANRIAILLDNIPRMSRHDRDFLQTKKWKILVRKSKKTTTSSSRSFEAIVLSDSWRFRLSSFLDDIVRLSSFFIHIVSFLQLTFRWLFFGHHISANRSFGHDISPKNRFTQKLIRQKLTALSTSIQSRLVLPWLFPSSLSLKV